jgi:hypothetical protein
MNERISRPFSAASFGETERQDKEGFPDINDFVRRYLAHITSKNFFNL